MAEKGKGIEEAVAANEVENEPEKEDNESAEEDETPAAKKVKESSRCWVEFTKGTPVWDKGKLRTPCTCKKCGTVIMYHSKTGTGNMLRHMAACVKKEPEDLTQLYLNHDVSLRSAKFDPEKFRKLLSAAIVMHDYPLSMVEHVGIRAVFNYLREGAPTISRNTAKADLMKGYAREKFKMKDMLAEAPGRISLTSDLWTSIATDGYISLTAHFVDKNWVLQKRIISFSIMPPPHTAIELNNKIISLVHEWGIEGKLFSITLDNASSNTAFVELMRSHLNMKNVLVARGKYLHQRCCAHIINLIVQDGLKTIDGSVEKVRETVKYIKGSQARKQRFLECVSYSSLNPKRGLRQDVPTRWNSTYLMLDSACYFRRALVHLNICDPNYNSCPSEEEWEKIEKIKRFLGTFYEITRIFSGVKYPTANLYFPAVFKAYNALREAVSDDAMGGSGYSGYLKVMAVPMLQKFEKYWSEFSMILCIAVILDPRCKLQFVLWSYQKMYKDNSDEYAAVRRTLYSLFDEYKKNYDNEPQSSTRQTLLATQVGSESPNSGNTPDEDMYEAFDYYSANQYDLTSQKSELDLYLEEKKLDRKKDFDIINYWKNDEARYPILARMARDILAIPISTVASESAFSGGGRVLDQYRSKLSPEVVEATVCCKDWIFGDMEDKEFSIDDLAQDVINLNNQTTEGARADGATT